MTQSDAESFTVGNITAHIRWDPDPMSPRDFDNLGTMVCWHRRHTLGDKHRFHDAEAFLKDIIGDLAILERMERWVEGKSEKIYRKHGRSINDAYLAEQRDLLEEFQGRLFRTAEKKAVILPLYLYDHSGISIRTTSFYDPWDSGQVGFVYVTLEKVRKDYGRKLVNAKLRALVAEVLNAEVGDYDDFLTGNVFGYQLESEDGEEIDACWGFFGLDVARTAAKEAAEMAKPA